ncbi:MAG: TetR family transcriptional regulator C-terminal domain-containing protein [Clostridia bacterium]|nr:TetR family transcriptional regulator C-terminal domain-containing protein [Clostridia bacterium]
MNVKDNQRARLSKKMFQNAMLELLEEKNGIEKISARELCTRAELNRSTFYAHYTEPREVLLEAEEETLTETSEYIRKIGAEQTGGGQEYLAAFFRYIRDNGRTFRVLLVTAADPEFKSRFMQISLMQLFTHLRLTMDADKQQYILAYLLNGSFGVITQWICADYAASVSDIVDLLLTLNRCALSELAV